MNNKANFFSDDKFFFSNENYQTGNIITTLKNFPNLNNVKGVAIIVGEGHFLSILPELFFFIDSIIFFDINAFLHHHLKFMIECINQSSNPKEYLDIYEKKLELFFTEKNIKLDIARLKSMQERSVHLVGPDHFLTSQERFTECRNTLHKLKLDYYLGDIYKTEDINYLCNILKKKPLKLLNITNLKEHSPNPYDLQKKVDLLCKHTKDTFLLQYSYPNKINPNDFFPSYVSYTKNNWNLNDIPQNTFKNWLKNNNVTDSWPAEDKRQKEERSSDTKCFMNFG